MTPEPLTPGHILTQMSNVTLTPHVGTSTVEARKAIMDTAVANLVEGLNGRPMPSPVC